MQKNSFIISKGDIFDSLCSIGTLILMDAYPQKDKISKIMEILSKLGSNLRINNIILNKLISITSNFIFLPLIII